MKTATQILREVLTEYDKLIEAQKELIGEIRSDLSKSLYSE
jgi:hypothetical protein